MTKKRHSKYLIRKQTEKTLGYHFTFIRLANLESYTGVFVDMNKQEVSNADGNMKFGTTLKSNFFI